MGDYRRSPLAAACDAVAFRRIHLGNPTQLFDFGWLEKLAATHVANERSVLSIDESKYPFTWAFTFQY